MKKIVSCLGLVAVLALAAPAAAIPVATVGGLDQLVLGDNVADSDAAEAEFMADYLGLDPADIQYQKIDVGGSAWIPVDGSSTLYAFDFSSYVTDPSHFLVKLGNAEFSHYLFENKDSLQYAVIDLSLFNVGLNAQGKPRGEITIASISHSATAGAGTTSVPE